MTTQVTQQVWGGGIYCDTSGPVCVCVGGGGGGGAFHEYLLLV